MSDASTREPSGNVADYDELANDPALADVDVNDIVKMSKSEAAKAAKRAKYLVEDGQDEWMAEEGLYETRSKMPRHPLAMQGNPYLLAFRA